MCLCLAHQKFAEIKGLSSSQSHPACGVYLGVGGSRVEWRIFLKFCCRIVFSISEELQSYWSGFSLKTTITPCIISTDVGTLSRLHFSQLVVIFGLQNTDCAQTLEEWWFFRRMQPIAVWFDFLLHSRAHFVRSRTTPDRWLPTFFTGTTSSLWMTRLLCTAHR